MTRTNIPFFAFENEGAQLFLIWVIFWILILKLSWVFRGKIDVSLENNSWLPNSAQPARSAQTVENSHSFFNVSYTWYKSLVRIQVKFKTLVSQVSSMVWPLETNDRKKWSKILKIAVFEQQEVKKEMM